MEITVLGKKFQLPSPSKEWFDMTDDERMRRMIDELRILYPSEFSKRPPLEGPAVDPRTGNYSESALAQMQWGKDNPFAYKLWREGKRRSIPEGFTVGHGGESEAAIRSLFSGNIPFLKGDFEGDYKKQLKEIDTAYRIFEHMYPVEATVGEVGGGLMLGGVAGLGKTAVTKAPEVARRTWGMLAGSEKFVRFLKSLGIGVGTGYGIHGTYQYGKGRGGRMGWEETSEADRLKTAFLGERDERWPPTLTSPYVLGPASGFIPQIASGTGRLLRSFTGSPGSQISKEKALALDDVVGAGWEQTNAWRKLHTPSLLDEIDPVTQLPLKAMQRGADDPLLTITEGATPPVTVRGQTEPLPQPLTALERELKWSLYRDPVVGAVAAGGLKKRAEGSTNRIIDQLYDASLGAERDAGAFLQTLNDDLNSVYTKSYGKAYLTEDMPVTGSGSFREIMQKSMGQEEDSILAIAYEKARSEMNQKIAQRTLGEDVGIFSIPSDELTPMVDLETFLTYPTLIPVYQAHAIARRAGEEVKTARKAVSQGTASPYQASDLDLADTWIRLWNQQIDKRTMDYKDARSAYRTGEVYKDSLKEGRNLKDMTPAEVEDAYNSLKAPHGLSEADTKLVRDNMRKLFVSGAIEKADLSNLDSLSSILKGGEMAKLEMAIQKEGRMSGFTSAMTIAQGGATAQELERKGAGWLERIIHGAPAAAFSLPFYLSREAGAIGRAARMLKNQAIAAEIQRLLSSTEPVTTRDAMREIENHARKAASVEDRAILNTILRLATAPEVEKEFPISKATGRGADYMRKDLMGRVRGDRSWLTPF